MHKQREGKTLYNDLLKPPLGCISNKIFKGKVRRDKRVGIKKLPRLLLLAYRGTNHS